MTDADPPPSERVDQLREEAAAWFARMRSDDAADHQAAFEGWLARGAAHRAAYNRIGEMFAEAKILKDRKSRPERATGSRLRVMPIVVVALAGAVAVGSIVHRTTDGDPHRQVAPAVGRAPAASDAIRTIALQRGSRAILDAGAIVIPSVAGNDALSRLELGRARFILAHAPSSSQILAGNVEFRSDGGTVDLWLRPDGSVDAQMIGGDGRVAPAVWNGSGLRPRFARLLVGQRYAIDPDGRVSRRPPVMGTDWPDGVLEYRGAPLREVIDEANRYSPIKIVLMNPALGDRRVSGRFRVDDPVVLAQRLARALSLDLDRSQAGRLVLVPEK